MAVGGGGAVVGRSPRGSRHGRRGETRNWSKQKIVQICAPTFLHNHHRRHHRHPSHLLCCFTLGYAGDWGATKDSTSQKSGLLIKKFYNIFSPLPLYCPSCPVPSLVAWHPVKDQPPAIHPSWPPPSTAPQSQGWVEMSSFWNVNPLTESEMMDDSLHIFVHKLGQFLWPCYFMTQFPEVSLPLSPFGTSWTEWMDWMDGTYKCCFELNTVCHCWLSREYPIFYS